MVCGTLRSAFEKKSDSFMFLACFTADLSKERLCVMVSFLPGLESYANMGISLLWALLEILTV